MGTGHQGSDESSRYLMVKDTREFLNQTALKDSGDMTEASPQAISTYGDNDDGQIQLEK